MLASFLFFSIVSQHCYRLFPSVHKLLHSLSIQIFGLMSQPVAHNTFGFMVTVTLLRPSSDKLADLYTFFGRNMWRHKQLTFSNEFQLVCTIQQKKKDNWSLFNPGACFLVANLCWSPKLSSSSLYSGKQIRSMWKRSRTKTKWNRLASICIRSSYTEKLTLFIEWPSYKQ